MAGLLIVNADDWGYDGPTTDAIARAFEAGAITSASAMVFMEDSDRAAGIARTTGLPTGLHLNLIEPYSASDVPADVRERQERLVRHFSRHRLTRWTWNPRLTRLVRAVVGDQLARYRELFGGEPTHMDGHQHMHLAPTVIASGALWQVPRLRAHFTFRPGEKSALNRGVRSATNAYLQRRAATTERFVSIRTIHPDLGGAGLEEALSAAAEATVEVMTHPGWGDELRVLTSDDWRSALAGLPLGSFADLDVRPV